MSNERQDDELDAIQDAKNDAEFIRRISKELRDCAPTPAEIHFFVNSKDAGKRQRLVGRFTPPTHAFFPR